MNIDRSTRRHAGAITARAAMADGAKASCRSAELDICVRHAEPAMRAGLQVILSGHPGLLARAPVEEGCTCALPHVIVADYAAGVALARDDARAAVLVVTARDSAWDVRCALEHGVRGYVTQSCTPEELVGAVRMLARGGTYMSDDVARRMVASAEQVALTARESEVLQQLAEGHCNKIIARHLGIEVETVKTHVKRVMNKLGATARTHAVAIAAERGLVMTGLRAALPAARPA